ncbi:hypothetical protein, partial [uncultured Porphyromonas sp.]|uniref:hypothetical protein n=1 Tax=uncultured Porphyromonas sp. TaxID=159274 RepID=UPI0026218F2D
KSTELAKREKNFAFYLHVNLKSKGLHVSSLHVSDHSDSSDYSDSIYVSDPHVEISKPLRGEETFSTWRRNKTSEESNETSEEMFRPHVKNKK